MVYKWFFGMFTYYSKTNLVDKDNPVAILYYWHYRVRSFSSRVRDSADKLWHMGWVGFYLQGSKQFEVCYIWVRPNPNYNISINSTYALPTLPWYQQYLVYQTHIMNITYLLGMKSLHPYIQLGAQAQTKQININGSER